MKFGTYVNILSLLGGSVVLGDDEFTVNASKACYEDTENVTIIVQYNGTGIPLAVKWKFDKMINDAAPLIVVLNYCLASAGADEAFPEDRMTYECDTVNNQYNFTIISFNEASDAGVWEAAISVGGSFTSFRSVNVKKCSATTTAAPGSGGGCSAGCIGGIVGGVVGLGVAAAGVVGGVAYKKSRGKKEKKKEYENRENPSL